MLQEHFFSDLPSVIQAMQSALVLRLQEDLQDHEHVSLFLSGGTSPVPLYQALAHTSLPWHRVEIALVDERFVPVTDKSSNEKLLRENMLREHAAAAGFTGMSVASIDEQNTLTTVLPACNARYARLPHPYSAAVLGMGSDGHTASLFPGAAGLEHALAETTHCAAIQARPSSATGTVTERITMTPWALLQCRCLYLLITGDEKKSLYEQAKTTADPQSLPIAIFLQQQHVPVAVFWCP